MARIKTIGEAMGMSQERQRARKSYTANSTFRAAWCPCGHSFSLEYRKHYGGETGELLSAAARFVHRDQYGQEQLYFKIVPSCPVCGRTCDEAWAGECYGAPPENTQEDLF